MVAPTEFDTRTTTIQRPAPFIEAAGTAFTKRLTPLLDPARATKIDPLYFSTTRSTESGYIGWFR